MILDSVQIKTNPSRENHHANQLLHHNPAGRGRCRVRDRRRTDGRGRAHRHHNATGSTMHQTTGNAQITAKPGAAAQQAAQLQQPFGGDTGALLFHHFGSRSRAGRH